MQRCIALAEKGAGSTAPNPLVGAVLVHNERIIGEGFHRAYGGPHAEVNCLANVLEEDATLICESTLYVSLEPCAHFGKTPPCANLIIEKRIPRVIIGCRDSFERVNGRGIEKLSAAGVIVQVGIMEKECRALNKRFFCFNEKKRPYIILKWAQSINCKIGRVGEKVKISNEFTDRLVHKWRAEEATIFAGSGTIRNDDPALTTRLWQGKNPVRITVDNFLSLDPSAKIFNSDAFTIIINTQRNERTAGQFFFLTDKSASFKESFVRCLNEEGLNSVLVEGGAEMLQVFIEADIWDEARVVVNTQLNIIGGIPAPELKNQTLVQAENFFDDRIMLYKNNENEFL